MTLVQKNVPVFEEDRPCPVHFLDEDTLGIDQLWNFWIPLPTTSRPFPFSSNTNIKPTNPLPPFPGWWHFQKYNLSKTDTAINCPTYGTSSNGTLDRERTSKNTVTALPIYRGHSNSQRLAQDGFSLWDWSARKEHLAEKKTSLDR